MGLRYGRLRGWRFALATAVAVAATGVLSPVTLSANATPAKPTRRRVPTGSTTRQRNSSTVSPRTTSGPTWSSSSRSPTPIRALTGTRPATRGARLQGLGRLRGRRYEGSGLRRDVAGVQVPLLQLRRDPVMREESPTPHSFGLGTDFNPGPVAGTTSAKLQPAGGIIVPATPTPSSASGCAPPTSLGSLRATSP